MAKLIRVRGTGDNRRVVLSERHADHPDGYVLIANNGKVHEVAETDAVKLAIGEGRLELADDAKSSPSKPSVAPAASSQAQRAAGTEDKSSGGATSGSAKPA